jgi:tRNA1(Val) A37 N6-methylase TrmN6
MTDYSQPDFYKFNQDSIQLVNWVAQKKKTAKNILDLCAGCGVIGIELANKFAADSLTLVEMQKDYLPHIQLNLTHMLNSKIESHVFMESLGTWKTSNTFDLIVCNPPYFLPGHGEVSQDARKHHARTFVIDDWNMLIGSINALLEREGQAFIVVRNDPKIIKLLAPFNLKTEFVGTLMILELSGLNKN